MKRRKNAFSNLSSQPRRWGGEAAWAWLPLMGLSRTTGDLLMFTAKKEMGRPSSIYLPTVKPERRGDEGVRQETAMKIQKGEGTVLVVDDEEMVVDVGSQDFGKDWL
jgi:hypothetical protein